MSEHTNHFNNLELLVTALENSSKLTLRPELKFLQRLYSEIVIELLRNPSCFDGPLSSSSQEQDAVASSPVFWCLFEYCPPQVYYHQLTVAVGALQGQHRPLTLSNVVFNRPLRHLTGQNLRLYCYLDGGIFTL